MEFAKWGFDRFWNLSLTEKLIAVFILFQVTVFSVYALLRICIWWNTRKRMKRWGLLGSNFKPVVVGFFHPNSSDGGGGERVLWQSISALQKRYDFARCVVYTKYDPAMSSNDIVTKVQERFSIFLKERVQFVELKWVKLAEPSCWRRLTILGQSLGAVFVGLEALLRFKPHFFIDTTGHAFVVPVFKWLGGCKTASYVHYPTVSTDMIEKVKSSESSYNNSSTISQSKALTNLKLFYYRFFAKLYGFAGRKNDIVMVNSSWTHGHISKLWKSHNVYIIYPPCDTSSFEKLPLKKVDKKFKIVSIGQFRPEKDHTLQLTTLRRFLNQLKNYKERETVELVLIGSCRNQEDNGRVIELRRLAQNLKIDKNVRFEINVPFAKLKEELAGATAAIHTMWNEHFGIGLVECMSAGCIMIGHRSGGPKLDIVVKWKDMDTGFLASSEEDFTNCLCQVFKMDPSSRLRMASCAREAMRSKFSVQVFETSFIRATEHIFG